MTFLHFHHTMASVDFSRVTQSWRTLALHYAGYADASRFLKAYFEILVIYHLGRLLYKNPILLLLSNKEVRGLNNSS